VPGFDKLPVRAATALLLGLASGFWTGV